MSSEPQPRRLAFVGQGPNRTAWQHGLAAGRQFAAIKLGVPADDPKTELPAIGFAEKYCARVAITGSVGSKLAKLLDLPLADFWRRFGRRNLNARWGGKNGKGDAFDREEGNVTAGLLLGGVTGVPEFTDFVLLGDEVARCFGVRVDWLEIKETRHEETNAKLRFLKFPHPSGISTWWNDNFNRFRARKRLREFIEQTTNQ